MGTDIHIQVEVLGEDGVWKISPRKPFLNYQDAGFTWADDPSGRDYNLFAFIGDVRNGFGFAGVVTGNRIEPQFPHRDFPKGVRRPQELVRLRRRGRGRRRWDFAQAADGQRA